MWSNIKFWLLPLLLLLSAALISLESARVITSPHPDCMGDPAC